MLKFGLLMIVIVFCFVSKSQTEYEVNIDNRNIAIDINKEAKKLVEDNLYEQAISKIMESVKIDSLLRETYIIAYKLWYKHRNYTDTISEIIKKGKRIFSDDDEIFFYSAEIYRYNSQIPEAILEYTNAVNYAKRNGEDFYLVPYYYFNRANCMQKMQINEGALADYNYAIKLNPEFASAYHNRGICLYKLGKKEEACADWSRAYEMGYSGSVNYVNKYCK